MAFKGAMWPRILIFVEIFYHDQIHHGQLMTWYQFGLSKAKVKVTTHGPLKWPWSWFYWYTKYGWSWFLHWYAMTSGFQAISPEPADIKFTTWAQFIPLISGFKIGFYGKPKKTTHKAVKAARRPSTQSKNRFFWICAWLHYQIRTCRAPLDSPWP